MQLGYILIDLTNLFVSLQPEDWDDREYIGDPDDVKPEVTCLVNMVAILKISYFC